eukprot:1338697-Karenia_brevis.AAC.1
MSSSDQMISTAMATSMCASTGSASLPEQVELPNCLDVDEKPRWVDHVLLSLAHAELVAHECEECDT